jgi:hypothetical protein
VPENSGEEEEADAHYGADYPQQRHDNHSDTNRVTCDVTSPLFFFYLFHFRNRKKILPTGTSQEAQISLPVPCSTCNEDKSQTLLSYLVIFFFFF